ncbi:MAG: clostripain-related cysteine peptidase [Thermoguttaceae bacterium]
MESLEQRAMLAANWTVLVYLDANNSLESFGVTNVQQMETVGSTANMNVVVQFAPVRPGSGDFNYSGFTDTRRAKIGYYPADTGSTMTSFSGSNYTSIGTTDSGNPTTLENFIKWGVATYPASHYILDIWDHGGGLDGAAWDDSSGNNITFNGLRQAISGAGTHMDVVGFDACLMSMEETAHQLNGLADVMVASEETIPGPGWPYDKVLGDLKANTAMTASQLGTKIVQDYGAYYNPQEQDTTLSAVDLNKEPALATSLDAFAQTAIGEADWTTINNAWETVPYFVDPEWSGDDLDLGAFLSYVKTNTADSVLGAAAAAASAAYTSTIIANYSGSYEGGTGMAIYNPGQGETIRSDYTAGNFLFVNDTHWLSYLTAFENNAPPTALYSVTSSTPAANGVVAAGPTDFLVNFSNAFASAPAAADFTVSGHAANSVTASNGNTTLDFHFTAAPVTLPGTCTMSLVAGAVTEQSNGALSQAWTASFTIAAPAVASLPLDAGTGANDGVADTFRIVRNGAYLEAYVDGALKTVVQFVALKTITVNGSSDADTLTVDYSGGDPVPDHSVANPVGATGIVFNGGAGTNALNVTDGDFTGVTETFTGTQAGGIVLKPTVTTAGTVTYTGVTSLVSLATDSVADLVLTLPPASRNPDASLGDVPGHAANTSELSGSTFASTTFTNPSNSLTVNLGNQGDTITVGAMSAGFSPAGAGVAAPLVVNGGSGNDTFKIDATDDYAGKKLGASYQKLQVAGGAGSDTYDVSSDGTGVTGNLNAVSAPLVIVAGNGSNTLNVSDQSATLAAGAAVVTKSTIAGLAPATITYSATGTFGGGINITGTDVATGDNFAVQSTLAGAATKLNTGGGADTVAIAADNLAGSNTFLGGSGADHFILNVTANVGGTSLSIQGNDPGAGPSNRHVLDINDSIAAGRTLNFAYPTPLSGGLTVTGSALTIPINVGTMETVNYTGGPGNNASATVVATTTPDTVSVVPSGANAASVTINGGVGASLGPDLSLAGLASAVGATGLTLDGHGSTGNVLVYSGPGPVVTPTGAGAGNITHSGAITVNYVNFQSLLFSPTLSAISNPAAINENAGIQAVALAGIGPGTGSSFPVLVTATSDNTALIPNPSVSYTSGATGSISYQPLAYAYGTAHITVTVRNSGPDGILGNSDDLTFSQTFTVVVNHVYQAPTLNPIANPAAINENAGVQTVALSGITAGPGESEAMQVTATTDNTTLLPSLNVTYASPGTTGSLSYQPAAFRYGTAHVTVTVQDVGGIAFSQTFTVTVTQVNHPPAITSISGPAGAYPGQSVAFTAGFSDIDIYDTHTATWNWGDGTTTTGAVVEANGSGGTSGTHAYTTLGNYTVTLTIADQSGATAKTTHAVTVNYAWMTPDAIDPTKTDLVVYGVPNDLILFGTVTPGTVMVAVNNRICGTFTPTGYLVAYGGGNDNIMVSSKITLPSILRGGPGHDVLVGGGGRNLLIGGSGTSQLTAGSRGDLLIAGSTAYDNNLRALESIMAEWNSGDSYLKREAYLTGTPGGRNGSYYLKPGTTVTKGSPGSTLTGGAGADLFFASYPASTNKSVKKDTLTGLTSDEVIVNLG